MTHEHTFDGPCLTCLAVVITAERYSGPVAPARFDPLSPADRAALAAFAARLTELAELPLEDGEPT